MRYSDLDYAKIFYDQLVILENPERHKISHDVYNCGSSLLVHEKMQRGRDAAWCIWVSEENLDVSMLRRLINSPSIIVSAFDHVEFVNIPSECSVATIETSHKYERSGGIKSDMDYENANIVNLHAEHLSLFSSWPDDQMTKQYTTQYKNTIQWQDEIGAVGSFVYGLMLDGALISCVMLRECRMPKYNARFNRISGLYTPPGRRNKGYMKRLVTLLTDMSECCDFIYPVDTVDGKENLPSKAVALACGFKPFAHLSYTKIDF